jgi:hypothetical protein
MRMQQAWRLNMAVVAVMTVALLGGWGAYQGLTGGTPPAWAADFDCDTELLAGRYGFNADGVLVGDPVDPDDDRFFAAVGVLTLRENGTLTVTLRQIHQGEPGPRRETYQGTYTVEPDCLGTAMFADSSWDFVAANNGTEIYLATTERGTVITADAKRLFTPPLR